MLLSVLLTDGFLCEKRSAGTTLTVKPQSCGITPGSNHITDNLIMKCNLITSSSANPAQPIRLKMGASRMSSKSVFP